MRQKNIAEKKSIFIKEADFSVWMGGLEIFLDTDPAWRELLYYQRISLFDVNYFPLYNQLLNLVKYGESVSLSKEYALYAKFQKAVQKFRILIKKLYNYSPQSTSHPVSDQKIVFIAEAFPNIHCFPVLQSLQHDFGFQVVFTSWNPRLEKPVRDLGLDYIQIQKMFGNKYNRLFKEHEYQVGKLLKRVDFHSLPDYFSKHAGDVYPFDFSASLHQLCVKARVYIDIYNELLSQYSPDVVVLFNEISPPGRALAKVASINRIPSVTVQHGLFLGKVYTHLVSDRIIVWGDISKQFWMNRGCANEQVYISGAIGYDSWHQQLETNLISHKIENPGVFVIGQNPAAYISKHDHRETIWAVINAAIQLPSVRFIIKPHPGESQDPYHEALVVSGVKNVELITEGSITEHILRSDIVVTIFSTAALNAMLNSKPVIVLNLSGDESVAPYISASLLVENVTDLISGISNLLSDKTLYQHFINEGRRFVLEYMGEYDGQAHHRAAKYISEMAMISSKV